MLPTYTSFGLLSGDRTAVFQLRIFQGGMEEAALHRWPSHCQEVHLVSAGRISCARVNSAFSVHTCISDLAKTHQIYCRKLICADTDHLKLLEILHVYTVGTKLVFSTSLSVGSTTSKSASTLPCLQQLCENFWSSNFVRQCSWVQKVH